MTPKEIAEYIEQNLSGGKWVTYPVRANILSTLLSDYKRQSEEIERLEDELYDAKQVPWPEWSVKIVKLVRSYSGYDGYDDATDGVDVVGEVDEALSELHSEAERLRETVARQSALLEEARKVLVEYTDLRCVWTDPHNDEIRSRTSSLIEKILEAKP